MNLPKASVITSHREFSHLCPTSGSYIGCFVHNMHQRRVRIHSIFVVWSCNRHWKSSHTICTVLSQNFPAANRVWVDWNVGKWWNKCHWRRTITTSFHINDWQEHWRVRVIILNSRRVTIDHFANDQVLKEVPHTWLGAQLRTFYSDGTQEHVQTWTKCVQNQGETKLTNNTPVSFVLLFCRFKEHCWYFLT